MHKTPRYFLICNRQPHNLKGNQPFTILKISWKSKPILIKYGSPYLKNFASVKTFFSLTLLYLYLIKNLSVNALFAKTYLLVIKSHHSQMQPGDKPRLQGKECSTNWQPRSFLNNLQDKHQDFLVHQAWGGVAQQELVQVMVLQQPVVGIGHQTIP